MCRLADECYVLFYSKTYLWSFSPNYCGFVLGKVLDFGTGVTVFAVIIIFDLITIFERIIGTVEESLFQAMRRKLRLRELKFFAQSCLQFGLFVIKLTNFYFISEYFATDPVTYHWPLFFTTTFAWECTHCVDGYVLRETVQHHRHKFNSIVYISDLSLFCSNTVTAEIGEARVFHPLDSQA
ncbi:unnamed protein product [Angiostrongylus costaricensis]|uniref:7TM_GPCR_Srx domain-containing protein n=1 Tax=Angiostrongylus costaricensis TaxID=334426 RepID=A0A0R3PHX4_ANGCS|nr:unnamed protein product [Angiostrongylus costaricensis]